MKNPIEVGMTYLADLPSLYKAWTDPQELRFWWWGEPTIEARTGGRFRWGQEFQNGVYHAIGEVLEAVPNERLVLQWGWEDEPDKYSRCEVTFRKSCEGLSQVVVRHDRKPHTTCCEEGWTNALSRLDRVPSIAKQTYDWSRFSKSIIIQSPIAKVKEAWLTTKGLESWFVRSAKFSDGEGKAFEESAIEGIQYQFSWSGGDQEKGTFYRVLDNEILFSFGNPKLSDGSMGEVMVHLQLKPLGKDKTNLILEQYGMPVNEKNKIYWHLGCHVGWSECLYNLKACLEHKIDLRKQGE